MPFERIFSLNRGHLIQGLLQLHPLREEDRDEQLPLKEKRPQHRVDVGSDSRSAWKAMLLRQSIRLGRDLHLRGDYTCTGYKEHHLGPHRRNEREEDLHDQPSWRYPRECAARRVTRRSFGPLPQIVPRNKKTSLGERAKEVSRGRPPRCRWFSSSQNKRRKFAACRPLVHASLLSAFLSSPSDEDSAFFPTFLDVVHDPFELNLIN